MSDDIKFKFDLDASDAIGEIEKTKGALDALSKGEQLLGLASKIGGLLGPLGLVATAVFAVKKAMDFAWEGEELEKIDRQFNTLATTAGLSAEALKSGIEKATNGFMGLDDAMKLANKSISLLGGNADKIPVIMQQARNASKALGVDFQISFDVMSMAIATGNTRMLRQIGITLDANEAMKKYALAHNTVTTSLTEFQRQEAIADALLEKTGQKFKNISSDHETLHTASRKLSIAWKDLNDTISVFFSEKTSSAFAKSGGVLTSFLDTINKMLKPKITEGAEKQKAEIELLTESVEKLKNTYLYYSNSKSAYDKAEAASYKMKLEAAQKELDIKKAIFAAAEDDARKAGRTSGSIDPKVQQQIQASKERAEREDAEKENQRKNNLLRETKFQQDITALKQSNLAIQMSLEDNYDAYVSEKKKELQLLDLGYAQKKQALENEMKINGLLTQAEFNQRSLQLDEELRMKKKELKDKEQQDFINVLQKQAENSKTFYSGFKNQMELSAAQAKQAYEKTGGYGVAAFKGLELGAKNAFKAMGKGSGDAAEQMKKAMLGSIAAQAEAQGSMFLSTGLAHLAMGAPGGAVEVAEGGALLALAGLLESQAGGAGGGSIGAGSSSGSASSPSSGQTSPIAAPTPSIAQQGKAVTLNFSGSYFETEATQRRLVDLIRQETDATSYQYNQIPVV